MSIGWPTSRALSGSSSSRSRRAGDFPPLRSLDALPGNLPLQLTSFVGREREVQTMLALLAERRILTLTGVGGVGKTRRRSRRRRRRCPGSADGAWVIELAHVREPAAVDQAVAAVFGLKAPPGEDASEALLDSLRGKELLLVVDNCEHVLVPASSLVVALVRECPSVTILATSREALGVAGEHVIGVASLAGPADRRSGRGHGQRVGPAVCGARRARSAATSS